MLENIPLTRAMALSVHCRGPDRLQLKAPLAANVNDKGTSFGGSQVALATLAAWGLVWLVARQQGWNVDIVVARSEQHYRQPIQSDMLATCQMPNANAWQSLHTGLRQRGRGKIAIAVDVQGGQDAEPAMNFNGLFVAINNEQ